MKPKAAVKEFSGREQRGNFSHKHIYMNVNKHCIYVYSCTWEHGGVLIGL